MAGGGKRSYFMMQAADPLVDLVGPARAVLIRPINELRLRVLAIARVNPSAPPPVGGRQGFETFTFTV